MFLRQATAAQTRTVGPFLDSTDFKTPEDALTINASDVRLKINGAADVAKNSGGATADVNGMYALTWDATDTATVGEVQYSIVVAGALPVWGRYVVVEEAIYDALFAAGATGYDLVGAATAALAAYDPPTRAELTADAAAIIAAVLAKLPAALVGGRIAAVLDAALAEPAAVPAFGAATVADIVAFTLATLKQKQTQDLATGDVILYKADGVTPLATRTDTKVGNLTTKAAW